MSTATNNSRENHAASLISTDPANEFFAMNQRRNEFLATLAHELRNPLAPIKHGLLLMSYLGLSKEAEDLRAMMARQVDQIARLVDDLLDVSRIGCGKVLLQRESLSLSLVVQGAIEESIGLINENALTLEVNDRTATARVLGDRGRLTQVICNLLNNSAKFGRPGGKIQLTLEVVNDFVKICVRDDGIGISKDRLKDIFSMYSQIESAQGQVSAGLGIGLTLVRTLVELHGGIVDAESDGLGRGSTFTVSLPLAPAADVETVSIEKQATSDNTSHKARTFRVLVVDDMKAMRIISSKLFSVLGHESMWPRMAIWRWRC